ncbi:TrlF family AAA-like ATPase [Bradyrhizobium sp. SZCCHNRI2049]|uniref:TrlF family AAA-like ATPase n=1 Tax=Bradyrhizobium sp. SZCCHNRI2049 TaxID=3057287 RepID=UPI0029162649|nr:AAA family ATPase [Bradyrhizobium sp. SZCCHNRI2049]
MTDPLQRILQEPVGAQFFRADLHIHSFRGSHDVRDQTMTAENIVATAVAEGLSIIAITDHNEITNVEAALNCAKGTSLTVIPGIELSTPQGHLLLYVPTLADLQKLHGQLDIVDRDQQNSRCQNAMLECLNIAGKLAGFGILAHVDTQSGFEVENPGAKPHKTDVLCHPALLGIELKVSTSPISYSDTDPDVQRANMGQARIKRLGLGSRQFLGRVLNSDAHSLLALGKNAANDRKVTRLKMEQPSFDGLRIALEDADARVRIEDQVPEAIPRILGVEFEGGFLDGQVIQFGHNLNCIVGGRGTGKSTAFVAVRCLSGETDETGVVDSEVWPDQMTLCWEDQSGQQHTLSRMKDEDIRNEDDEDFGPTAFEIDCFGQGEAAKIAHDARSNPLALLEYLDKFVDLSDAVDKEDKLRETLLSLQSEIEKAEQQVALIPQYERSLATTRQQLAALKKPEVKELIELQRALATEREIRRELTNQISTARESIEGGAGREAIETIIGLADPSDLTVGANEYRAIITGANTFNKALDRAETQVNADLQSFEAVVNAQLTAWKHKDTEAQKKIDAKRRELESLKVTFDMSYITKLAKDEASYNQHVTNLRAWKPHLEAKRKERATVLKQRWAARAKVFGLRDAFARTASATLKEALTDLRVSLKYLENAYSPEATDQIIQAMGWRTNQQPRAAWLVETLTIPKLLEAIQKSSTKALTDIKTNEGVKVFDQAEAKVILERLSEPTVRFALERARLHDLPRLLVTRELTDEGGQKRFVVREFSKLSLGQQQSVLLALILSSDSIRPLIIDQPEDNLDGEFIYSTLVPVLRRAKERRQVIIVTHNPNVAVLGDAEQIIVMKAVNDHGTIVARGSIDHEATRDHACAILEGAREAFLRRAKMYGIRTS